MPWVTLWAEPISFTRHRGVSVYHTYYGMDARKGFQRFRFTTLPSDADERFHFDVRDLPVPGAVRLKGIGSDVTPEEEQALIREIIHDAIDRGILYGSSVKRE
jgi:hypothetical protein